MNPSFSFAILVFIMGLLVNCSPLQSSRAKSASESLGDNGRVLAGDMILEKSLINSGDGLRPQASFIDYSGGRWPNGVVPFEFAPTIGAAKRDMFISLCNRWGTRAKITCVVRTNQIDHVYVDDGTGDSAIASGCYSTLSYAARGRQELNLKAATCWDSYTILHEVGHTLGMIHEHQRMDRDAFISINEAQVAALNSASQILTKMSLSKSNLYSSYDFYSIMHYGAYLYDRQAPTISPKPPYESMINVIGRGTDLSEQDLETAAKVYGRRGDVQPPVINLVSESLGDAEATFEIAMNDIGGSEVYSWTCKLDDKSEIFRCQDYGQPRVVGAGGVQQTLKVKPLTAGTHKLVIRAEDSAGNKTEFIKTFSVNATRFAPVIISNAPDSLKVATGGTLTLEVKADANPAPTFQWYKDSVAIPGATSATYTISAASLDHQGFYRLAVRNELGEVMSGYSYVLIDNSVGIPKITSVTGGGLVKAGDTLTLTVSATGNPQPTFQWRKNGVDISGATSSKYIKANVSQADAANYTVIAKNTSGQAVSSPVTVQVAAALSAPEIISFSGSQVGVLGQMLTFAVVAKGNPAPTYQWRKNGNDIPGSVSPSFTIPRLTLEDQGAYSVRISNSEGSVISADAVLTVSNQPNLPVIVTQPMASVTVLSGTSLLLNVVANGAEKFQWYKNGQPISGATRSEFSVPSTDTELAGSYYVIVSNSFGSVCSSSSVVTLAAQGAAGFIVEVDFKDKEFTAPTDISLREALASTRPDLDLNLYYIESVRVLIKALNAGTKISLTVGDSQSDDQTIGIKPDEYQATTFASFRTPLLYSTMVSSAAPADAWLVSVGANTKVRYMRITLRKRDLNRRCNYPEFKKPITASSCSPYSSEGSYSKPLATRTDGGVAFEFEIYNASNLTSGGAQPQSITNQIVRIKPGFAARSVDLVLTSYEPVRWDLRGNVGAIRSVHVRGYHCAIVAGTEVGRVNVKTYEQVGSPDILPLSTMIAKSQGVYEGSCLPNREFVASP